MFVSELSFLNIRFFSGLDPVQLLAETIKHFVSECQEKQSKWPFVILQDLKIKATIQAQN